MVTAEIVLSLECVDGIGNVSAERNEVIVDGLCQRSVLYSKAQQPWHTTLTHRRCGITRSSWLLHLFVKTLLVHLRRHLPHNQVLGVRRRFSQEAKISNILLVVVILID